MSIKCNSKQNNHPLYHSKLIVLEVFKLIQFTQLKYICHSTVRNRHHLLVKDTEAKQIHMPDNGRKTLSLEG